MKEFGWAFIGAGKLAKIVAEQIISSGRHRIVSVYTRNENRCADFAARYGAFSAPTAREAILAPDVDMVYIVTPHNSHFEYAALALSLGKPVLCEKPMTVSAAERIIGWMPS